jgi:hypothetical protein
MRVRASAPGRFVRTPVPRAGLLRRAAWLASGAAFAVATHALAQSGAGYDLHWNAAAAGGATANAVGITVAGTVGQAAAGPAQPMSAAGYLLVGGFWSVHANDVIYRNGFD